MSHPVQHVVRDPERIHAHDSGGADWLTARILGRMGHRVRRIIRLRAHARGDALPDSDRDLLVVAGTLVPGERRGMLVGPYRAVREGGAVVEPHGMGEDRFEETRGVIGGLAYPAWSEGVVLYEHA